MGRESVLCRRMLSLAVCLFLAFPGLAAAPCPATAGEVVGFARPDDDEIVDEFKRYFRKYKDTPTRVEAILALEGTESVEVVDVLVPVLGDSVEEVVLAAVRVLGGFQTRAPAERLLELLEGEKKAERAIGLMRALEFGAYAGARAFLEPWLEHSSWEARRAAATCLAATASDDVSALLVPLCDDREPAVRCAAFDSLARLRSPAVVDRAIEHLDDSSWQARASAIGALTAVRHRDAIEPLIERMAVEEGRLKQDIAEALEAITGKGYGLRLDGWESFWKQYSTRFEIPTDEELARLRQKQAERRAEYSGADGAVRYHGVETPSRRIVFVVDISGSMEQEVSDRERYKASDYPSLARMEIVKSELRKSIAGLEPYVRFNILTFGTDVDAWKKKMVAANPLNRSSADTFLERLEPLGGASKSGLAEAGLAASANLEAGKTNTYGALMAALQVEEGSPSEYSVDADTVFFLSDGRPSTGRFIDPDEILAAVRRANELRRVVIHTFAIGEFQKGFMRKLAAENGGTFIDLGK